MKKILIVGCGSIGERHLRCFQKTGRATVAACDSNPTLLESIAQTYGVVTYPGLSAALAQGQFDGAVICTPAQTHLSIAEICLANGLPLLMEKPLSTGLGGTDELLSQVETAGVFTAVAYVYHSMPCMAQARDYLASGAAGKPLQVTVTAGQHFPTFRPAYRDIYYNNHDTGGGAIQDALTHLFNAVEWVLDVPTTQIFCEAAHQALAGVEVEDTVSVCARNRSVVTTYSLNQFQAPNETIVAIHCDGGSVAIEVHRQRWKTFIRGATDWEIHEAPVADRDGLFVAQASAFLDGMEGRPTNLCTLAEAIQTLKVNVAALESARRGVAVPIL